MKQPGIVMVLAVCLGGCAAPGGANAAAGMAPAVRIPESVLTGLLGPQALTPPMKVSKSVAKPFVKIAGGPPMARVDAANRAALREPVRENYLDAVQVYAWSPGALYRLYTAPGRVSDIALEPGETLVSVAAGDTARWIIGDTTSGSGPNQRTHILVKPVSAGLDTNLVIATDRRIYHVQVESSVRTAMASISWTYPAAGLLAVAGPVPPSGNPAGIPASSALDFGYVITGDRPAWRPLRVFNDGRQVFIEFPTSLAQGEAPPLFVSGADGRPGLVNYRVHGRHYVVDQLFSAAELRLGEARQQIVRIVRVQPALKRHRVKSS